MTGRGASVLGAGAAWMLSAGPFVLDAGAFPGASRAVLAALPWVAFAGLPRRADDGAWRGVALELALFVPPIALGAALDVRGGVAASEAWRIALVGAACATTLAFAARAAAADPRTRLAYALAWTVLVAGVPLLAGALVLFGSSGFGAPPAWLAGLAGASPLAWLLERISTAKPATDAGWAVLVTLLLCAALGWTGRVASRGATA